MVIDDVVTLGLRLFIRPECQTAVCRPNDALPERADRPKRKVGFPFLLNINLSYLAFPHSQNPRQHFPLETSPSHSTHFAHHAKQFQQEQLRMPTFVVSAPTKPPFGGTCAHLR